MNKVAYKSVDELEHFRFDDCQIDTFAVTENGVEVSRTEVNSSKYKMVPRSATVGTATSDPAAYDEIMAAIGTGNVDHVKNVIAILTAQAASADGETGQQ